ncbi:hypothetical protein HanRHA438_Chr08g0344851 [Helianthus annuus]|nr:hypothetical protein HanRHA438_Chr08g0344851 [Helianthus annuus]
MLGFCTQNLLPPGQGVTFPQVEYDSTTDVNCYILETNVIADAPSILYTVTFYLNLIKLGFTHQYFLLIKCFKHVFQVT